MKDFSISNHGSIILITPLSENARAWIDENVSSEPWQWLGSSLSVDPRYVENLVNGMVGDGLVLSD